MAGAADILICVLFIMHWARLVTLGRLAGTLYMCDDGLVKAMFYWVVKLWPIAWSILTVALWIANPYAGFGFSLFIGFHWAGFHFIFRELE
jgi:hypothetical protein